MNVSEVVVVIIIVILVWLMCKVNSDTKASHSLVVNCSDKPSSEKYATGKPVPTCAELVNAADTAEKNKLESYAHPEKYVTNSITPVENLDPGTASWAMCGNASVGYSDYRDYIRDISLDAQSQADHKKFVDDRLRNKQMNITGMSWPSDDFIYQPVPWVGLNRPRNVPYGNPTEVADVDHGMYEDERRVRL